jgi:4a-hydroxytetrahydrobiopterin dehydratase
MPVLSPDAAKSRLAQLPGWQIESGELAEQAAHHPDIDIRYNRVRLALVTHDAGGITEKDFDLAVRVQSLAP